MRIVTNFINESEDPSPIWIKGKSIDKIAKALEGKSDEEKINLAIKNKVPGLVKYLLKNIITDPSIKGNFIIREACKEGDIETVIRCLNDERVNPATHDNLPIRLAAYRGHYDIVKLLMNDDRIDPSDYNNAALRGARDSHHNDIIKLLLSDNRVKQVAKNSMMQREWFQDFLNEDLGGVSAPMATTLNTPGMGNAVPGGTSGVGSGDNWGNNLGTYTQSGKTRTKKKKTKKKLEEDNINPYDIVANSIAKKLGVKTPFKKGPNGTVKQKTFEHHIKPLDFFLNDID